MIINESFIRDVFRLIVWFPLRWSVAHLPLPLSFIMFRLMGDLLFLVSRDKRTAVFKSMKSHLLNRFQDEDISRATRYYFRQHILNTLFPFVIPRLNSDFLEKHVSIQGLEHVNHAIAKGNGCILIQGHLDIVQFPLFYLGYRGYQLGQIFYRHTQGLSWIGEKVQLRYRQRMEEKMKVQLFSVDGFQRPVLKWLKNNNVLMLNGDGTGGREFIGRYDLFPFLGENTYFPLGPYNLALKVDAPLLPTHIEMDGRNFRITIYPPLRTTQTGESAVFDLARKFISFLELKILARPETWHYWDSFTRGLLIKDSSELSNCNER